MKAVPELRRDKPVMTYLRSDEADALDQHLKKVRMRKGAFVRALIISAIKPEPSVH